MYLTSHFSPFLPFCVFMFFISLPLLLLILLHPAADDNNKNLSHFTQHALPRHEFSSKA